MHLESSELERDMRRLKRLVDSARGPHIHETLVGFEFAGFAHIVHTAWEI